MSPSDTFDRVMMSFRDAVLDDAHWPATSALIDDSLRHEGQRTGRG